MDIRNIKFKAKRLDNGEWVIGDLLHSYENGAIIVPIEGGGVFSVDPSTVCQYTGLKDREGNDIFEHDLLTRDGTVAYKVEYVNCGYVALYKDVDSLAFNLFVLSKSCRVYGNDLDRKEGEE